MIVARTTGLAGFTPLKQTGGSNQYNQEQENKKGTKKKGFWDTTQDVLDIGGFIPGVGVFLDLANAGISLGRAAFGDKEDRKMHLANAAMSGVAAVPGLDYAAAGAKGLNKWQKARKMVSPQDPLNYMKKNPIMGALETAAGVDYTFSDMSDLVTGVGYDKSSNLGVYDPFDSSQTGKAKDRTSYLQKGMEWGLGEYIGGEGSIRHKVGLGESEEDASKRLEGVQDFFRPQLEYHERWKNPDDKQPNEMPQHVKDFQDNMPDNNLSEEEQRKIMDKAIENNKKTNAPGGTSNNKPSGGTSNVDLDAVLKSVRGFQKEKYGKSF